MTSAAMCCGGITRRTTSSAPSSSYSLSRYSGRGWGEGSVGFAMVAIKTIGRCLGISIMLLGATARAADAPPAKPTPLFNGKDLTGWIARDKTKAELWTVATEV